MPATRRAAYRCPTPSTWRFIPPTPRRWSACAPYGVRPMAARIKSVANMEFRYVASVDEMKAFLDDTFGEGEEISSRTDIDDRPGIVVFMGNQTYGIHTEVWTGDNFHQAFMRGRFCRPDEAEGVVLEHRGSEPDRHIEGNVSRWPSVWARWTSCPRAPAQAEDRCSWSSSKAAQGRNVMAESFAPSVGRQRIIAARAVDGELDDRRAPIGLARHVPLPLLPAGSRVCIHLLRWPPWPLSRRECPAPSPPDRAPQPQEASSSIWPSPTRPRRARNRC